ncbi:MAG TPA: carboxypeptidase-like regulatory domain-containing protein [Terriglobales bacterium]|nr:carboxypeptidase-like regulatory domain-containing protein [Terriglobales bacterium]
MHRRLLLALIGCVALLVAHPTKAQTVNKTGATITGRVLGADGKLVPGASVTCETSSGLKPRAVHADAKGRFFITGLKQDSYDLRASSNGAYSDWERNIPVRKDQTKEITLQLLNGNTALSGVQPAKKKN